MLIRLPERDSVVLCMAASVADALRPLVAEDEILRACQEEYSIFAHGCGVVRYRERVLENLAAAENAAQKQR
jgi:hypothetical protein